MLTNLTMGRRHFETITTIDKTNITVIAVKMIELETHLFWENEAFPFSSIQRSEMRFYKADVKVPLAIHMAAVISWCESYEQYT